MALDQEILVASGVKRREGVGWGRRATAKIGDCSLGCFDIRYCRFANASCISPTDQKSLKLVLNDRYHFPLFTADGIPRKSTTDREIDN